MPITPKEVFDFCDRWLTTVMRPGTPSEQAAFFIDPDSRLYILQNGEIMTFQDNYDLHCQLTDEIHILSDFTLAILNASPDRVRAAGRFYWEAQYVQNRPLLNRIKALAGIDCIVERVASGELKFVLYMSSFHQLLPDSAPLELQIAPRR
jgi:hypothetical protein